MSVQHSLAAGPTGVVCLLRYTSEVYLKPGEQVISKVFDSTLFDHLDSTWDFKVGPSPSSTWLTFSVDFGFKSPLYRSVAAVFFEEVRLSHAARQARFSSFDAMLPVQDCPLVVAPGLISISRQAHALIDQCADILPHPRQCKGAPYPVH